MKQFIKIDNSIINDYFIQDAEMLKIFIYFLINANHNGKKYKSLVVNKGTLVIAKSQVKKKLNIDTAFFESKIKKLRSLGLIKFMLVERSFVINIKKYNQYQSSEQAKILSGIEERKNKFKEKIKLYISEVDKKILTEFYNYWTEPNKSNTKMKFELEKTWDTKRRINTWIRNDKKWMNKNSNKPIGLQRHEDFKQKERDIFGNVRSNTNLYSIGDMIKKGRNK